MAETAPDTARRSLVDAAYAALKDAIRNNELAPGFQASEQEIALRLGMSRTPVHEALIRLQEDGLVRVMAKRGVLICPLALDDLREIYDVIIGIEGTAAALLAQCPAQQRMPALRTLTDATDAMDQALKRDDLRAWAQADDAFHHALVNACGNSRLARIAQTINDQAHRARMLTLQLRVKPARSVTAHRAIIKAIRSGDATAAQTAAQSHRLAAKNELLPLIERIGLKQV